MSEVPKVATKAAEEVLPSVGLTYEGWLKAKEILLGNNPKAVSLKAAAQAAGVTPHELRLWARRAREGDPTLGDALTWAQEIPAVMDGAKESQGQVMEDLIWQRAVSGTEKPVIHKGKVTDTFVEYDPRREQAILKRRNPPTATMSRTKSRLRTWICARSSRHTSAGKPCRPHAMPTCSLPLSTAFRYRAR